MHFITKIGPFTLSSERYDEEDNIWYSWELQNSAGKSVSSRIWNILNNLRHEWPTGRGSKLGLEDIITWVSQNVSEADFTR